MLSWASLVAQLVKNPPAMWETWVLSLGWEDPLEKGKATTSVFWPREFHGLYSPWVHKKSDTAEWLSLIMLPYTFIYLLINMTSVLSYQCFNLLCLGIMISCCCSVTKLCRNPCNSVDSSTPSFSVLHYLPEFAQIHVAWVDEKSVCRSGSNN